jgi:H+/Cl- antiporter ClcA
VFGAAANTPIACTLLFVELFGGAAVVPAALALALAYVCSGHRGIYSTQRIEVRKHA